MLANPGFWPQLIDKWVEICTQIAGNLISATVIAAAGLFFWRWNKSRDLDAEEAARTNERRAHLSATVQGFANQAEASPNGYKAAVVARECLTWMRMEGLTSVGRNFEFVVNWEQPEARFNSENGRINYPAVQAELARDIEAIEVPSVHPKAVLRD